MKAHIHYMKAHGTAWLQILATAGFHTLPMQYSCYVLVAEKPCTDAP